MRKYKFYRASNYIVISDNLTEESFYGFVKEVQVAKSNANKPSYKISNVKDFDSDVPLVIEQLLKEDGSPYTESEFDTFYTQNTGNFNGGGSAPGVQSVTGSAVDNTDPQNPVINSVGGSQNLQQTLTNGSIATDRYMRLQSSTTTDQTDIYYSGVLSSSGVDKSYSYISNTGLISVTKVETSISKTLDVEPGKITYASGTSGGQLVFNFPISKPAGEYTLVTEDQITLQQTLDNGTNASFDGGDNTADILTTLSGTRKRVTFVTSTIGFGTSQFSVHDQLAILSNNTGSNLGGSFSVANGLSKIQQDNGSVGTTVQFNTPTSASILNFPAPSVAGGYTIALKEDLIPTINIIPDGNFIIPDGADTKMITLKDTDPQIVTLPAINNSIGSIYFITNDSTGTVDINSNTGGNDIWDSGTLVNTKPVISGTILRIINDGESFKIL